VTELDIRLFRALHDALGGGLLSLMAALTMIGGGWGALSILPLFVPVRTRRFAIAFAATIGVNALLVFGLKAAIARPRPWLVMPDIQPVILPGPSDFSFPSGHSAGSFCYATFLAVFLLKTRKGPAPVAVSAILLLLATGVALSRIALGVHFPGDITAGAIIGATSGAIGANLYLKRLRQPPAQASQADPS
jgi:membrane-associated phospholipid phosphatase